jgi:phospholipid/cholesterol/gamma-HCH transport system substrate-binding protein
VPFVNLAQDEALPANTLTLEAGQEFPVISTKLTELDALVQKLPDLEKNLSVLLGAANEVLNAENRQHFAELLANLDAASAQLPELITNLNQVSGELSAVLAHVDGVIKQSEKGVVGNLQALHSTLTAIEQTSQRVDTLAQDLNRMVLNNEGRINELLSEGGENVKQLLEESRRTAVSVRRLSDALEQNPSQFIYQPVPQGTELPR